MGEVLEVKEGICLLERKDWTDQKLVEAWKKNQTKPQLNLKKKKSL